MYDFSVLREIRKREGMTIENVSRRSGISSAVISKLERNQSSAELETLYKIGRVFGMTASNLIGLAESRLASKVESVNYESDGFSFQRISFGNMAAFLAEAKAGSSVFRPEIHQNDYETCWVLEGKVDITLPHENYELSAGQSVQFDAIQEHSYKAVEDTRMVIVHVRKSKRF